jgi:hypothetical protein
MGGSGFMVPFTAAGRQLSLDIYIILPRKIAGAEENTGGRKPEVSVARLSLPG